MQEALCVQWWECKHTCIVWYCISHLYCVVYVC